MCRSILSCVAVALSLLVSGLVASSNAGPPPTGTVSCTGVQGKLAFGSVGLETVNSTAPPHATKLQLKEASAIICDNSGVTGGRFPITAVFVSLDGRTVEGETCGDFLGGTLDLAKGKLKVKWRGDNNYGRVQTIASSKATVASVTYDSGSEKVVIVTNPIVRGAFAGSTMTYRMSLPSNLEDNCFTLNAAYSSWLVGTDGTSTIEVP
jgi:hypothetical protein